jgi:membrane protease YdiL (CAAX protease family)
MGALYWVTVNSVLEEYVWRWFVVEKLEDFLASRAAIVISALAFTLHHIMALQTFLSPMVVALAATGVFIGGAVWSWCYVRYRSVWPGYVSHAIVDVAVFGVGYHLMFLS